MGFEGYIDRIASSEIFGWAYDNKRPNDPVTIEILVEDQVVAAVEADVYREDLKKAGKGNGLHAFEFRNPDGLTWTRMPRARIQGSRFFLLNSNGAAKALEPRRFEGAVDIATGTEISGWAYDNGYPDRSLGIEICSDYRVIATLKADGFRQDLKDSRKGNGHHAFEFSSKDVPDSGARLSARIAGQRWSLPATTQDAGVPRWHAMFQHTLERGLPEHRHQFSQAPAMRPDEEIALAQRLIRAYQAAIKDGVPLRRDQADMWTGIRDLFHTELDTILRTSDARSLAEYLREFPARPVAHGILQGPEATKGLENPASASFVAAMFMDCLAALAEALGVLPVESAEQQGRSGENLFLNADDLADRVSEAIGTSVAPPSVVDRMFGLCVRRGIVQPRDLCGAYAAWRIVELLKKQGGPTLGVCEIGGGIGSAAYFCQQLGIPRYTIIDLPIINVVQAYRLVRALPSAPILLYGEPDNFGPDALRILPPRCFGAEQYNLVFNQDSFPEMNRDVSTEYLRKARAMAPALLSINQEAQGPQVGSRVQTIVRDLIADVGGYERVYRFPYWLRRGYVEELYVPSRAAD